MNFSVSFCNSCSGKMIKVAFYVSQGSVATLLTCGGKHANQSPPFFITPRKAAQK